MDCENDENDEDDTILVPIDALFQKPLARSSLMKMLTPNRLNQGRTPTCIAHVTFVLVRGLKHHLYDDLELQPSRSKTQGDSKTKLNCSTKGSSQA
ncbi:hypothetical protein GOBAR_DD17693 [Gossypium barbadense]|nr:hypothetical protein GOBAR_DD17693 [Gossypium barbadense]